MAGLTVAVVLIPQAIAYAYLAGVPPIYGLYAAFIPMILYGFLGTSPQMNVGPVAVSSILLLAGLSSLATPFSENYIELAILTALLVGIVQFSMGILRMGFIVNFLSHPVLSGFISAAAVIIISSQLMSFLGLSGVRQPNTVETVYYVLMNLTQIHILSLFIGAGSLVLLFVLRHFFPRFPGLLLVVALTTIGCYLFRADQYGLKIIGSLPSGFPSFVIPYWTLEDVRSVLPTVGTVSFVGFVESLSIAKGLELKHRSYRIDANQELMSLGISKIIGSFFQSIPTSGSFSRSALNDASGAHSGLSSIVSGVFVGLALLALTPLLYFIPQTVLAAAIIFSILKLLNIEEGKYLWKIRRRDFAMMIVTLVITILFGVEAGILSGITLSLLLLLYQNSRPLLVELGNVPGTNQYRNLERYPDARPVQNYMIVRFDNQLFYANSAYFRDKIVSMVDAKEVQPKYLILDASNIYDMDSTGLHALEDLYSQLNERKIQLVISGAKGTVRDIFTRSGFFEKLDKRNHFMYIRNAIAYSESDEIDEWHDAVMQSNY